MKFLGIVAVFLILIPLPALARRDTIPFVTFQLLDASTQGPISLAHVINQNRKVGTISDAMGYFHIPLESGDTLRVSALGYYTMTIPSWGQFSPDSLYYPVHLTSRIYQIKEVRITRFGSYERFIREVAKMELPKSEQEILQEKIEMYFLKTITQMDLKSIPQATMGVTFGKDWFTKQREKIEEKSREEKKWAIIHRKFSAFTVMELTGLEQAEAIDFMEFCNFTEGFILTASEYEVRKRILDKFALYQNLRNGSLPRKHD